MCHFIYDPQVNKLVRCLSLLKEYIIDCDEEYSDERGIPPHGKYVSQSSHHVIHTVLHALACI